MNLTSFVIPSIHRPTLQRAINSVGSSPCLVGYDEEGGHRSETRNKLIQQAVTPWVSFLDDDDIVLPMYIDYLGQEIVAHPTAGCIIFKTYFPHGLVIPAWPVIARGNIPISFSLRTDLAKKFPFEGERAEDYHLVCRLEEAGVPIIFSSRLAYLAKP